MKATSSSAITARPSICWPMENSMPPLSHQTHLRMTGSTYASA